MNCVQPPLPKKPSRGFAWACGPCSRASEKKMEARSTPHSAEATEAEEEEPAEEEIAGASNDTTRAPSPSGDDMIVDDHPATQAEIALAKMWPMRYLGILFRLTLYKVGMTLSLYVPHRNTKATQKTEKGQNLDFTGART